MATLPLSNTNVRLISGIPFNADYKNSRWFDTIQEQTTYFQGKPVSYSSTTFNIIKNENGMYEANVPHNADDLLKVNYCMFQNTSFSNKWFYAFVTNVTYKQKGMSTIHLILDVFQTWRFDYNFKPSFVVREHCKLWNTDGTPVVNTVDEGLNYGSEYDNVGFANVSTGIKWMVIVAKRTMHVGSDKIVEPTTNGIVQPLAYYVVPMTQYNTSATCSIGDLDVPIDSPEHILKAMYSFQDSVNNIVSIFITDHIGLKFSSTVNSVNIQESASYTVETATVWNEGSVVELASMLYISKMNELFTKDLSFGNIYSGYRPTTESKLMMYPYCLTMLVDFTGGMTQFRNEYFSTTNPTLQIRGSLGTSSKVSYSSPHYNTTNGLANAKLLSDEHALINNDPNDIPVVVDMLAAYIQGNRNSLMNQFDTTVWNGAWNTVNAGVGVGASLAGGNVAGAISSGISGVQGAGNTVLALQGMTAKMSDINNVPPSISKQGSNTSYTFGNQYRGVYIVKKQIKPEYQSKLEQFFNMFGYKLNEVKIPNFHTRRYWNYVQTESCIITGNIINDNLIALKSVFDRGITFWHTDDIGNYSLSNTVL